MPVLYLTEQGATLRKEGDVLTVTKEGATLQKVPAIKVEQVVVLGNVNLTTPVINYLLESGIDCVFCNSYGKYHGRLFSTESNFGLLRRQQLEAVSSTATTFAVAREIVKGKLLNQRTLMMRYRREHDLPSLTAAVDGLEQCLLRLDRAQSLDNLRGLEGRGSAVYYGAFKDVLKQDLDFLTRVRRPPTDPVNSLLSFGYTLLVYNMQAAVHTVGLDPFLGFLHTTQYSQPSLVLDLIEEFRSIVVDSVVLRVINTRAMTDEDFERPAERGKMVLLTKEAIKKFLGHYERRLQEEVQHPGTGNRVTYRRCFELQARQLSRVIMRRDPMYRPFLVK